jgi:hypothetical protein
MNPYDIFSQIGISPKIAQDVMLVLFVAFVSFVYGMLVGRYRLIPALVNIYASFAIVSVVPEKMLTDYNLKLILFFALWALLTIFSRRFFDVHFYGSGTGFLWRVFSMSFLQGMLLLSVAFSFVPTEVALTYISPNAFKYLVEGWAPLVWMVVPLVFLFFIYRRNR